MYNVLIVTFRIDKYNENLIFNIRLDFNGNYYNVINKKYFIVHFVNFMFDK